MGRRLAGSRLAEGGGAGAENGERNGAQVAPRKLANMRDLAKFVLKISDMGLGKQLLNGQSRYATSGVAAAAAAVLHDSMPVFFSETRRVKVKYSVVRFSTLLECAVLRCLCLHILFGCDET